MSLTSCCGSLSHNTSIAYSNSSYRCEQCTTFLYKGHFGLDTLDQSFKKYVKIKDNNILHKYDFPLLTYH